MGGTSSTYALSDADKIKIMEQLEEKYRDLTASEKSTNKLELFEKLSESIKGEISTSVKVDETKVTEVSDIIGKEQEAAEGDPSQEAKYDQSVPLFVVSSPSTSVAKAERRGAFDAESFTSPTHSKFPAGSSSFYKLSNPTSAQLLYGLGQDALKTNEDTKVAMLLSQLKSEEVVDSPLSDFRNRRLTYSKGIVHEKETELNDVYSPLKSRTALFSSSEFHEVVEKELPFPVDIMGTYSCHGIEPSLIEENGITEKINQDRGCVVHPFNNSNKEALFSVMDGHGGQGDRVADFVMKQIVVSLEKDPRLASDPIAALTEAYVLTNRALVSTDIEYMTSGTTCVTVYMREKNMFVANVGDSRAVMAFEDSDGNLQAKDLTNDHKPDDPSEQERIERMGGFVCPPQDVGLSARVYLDPEFRRIGLAMSRSIGDFAVKQVGVIAEPEILTYDVQDDYRFMILASDGVWEFITSQEAVDIVNKVLLKAADRGSAVYTACQVLIEEAQARWEEEEGDYRDDITAIIVRFPLPL